MGYSTCWPAVASALGPSLGKLKKSATSKHGVARMSHERQGNDQWAWLSQPRASHILELEKSSIWS